MADKVDENDGCQSQDSENDEHEALVQRTTSSTNRPSLIRHTRLATCRASSS